jgi:hypothetical protein
MFQKLQKKLPLLLQIQESILLKSIEACHKVVGPRINLFMSLALANLENDILSEIMEIGSLW